MLFAWGAVVSLGRKLPYIDGQFTGNIRDWGIFIVLYAGLMYLLYVNKVAKSGRNAMMTYLASLPARKSRIGTAIAVNMAAILISAGIAFTSMAFPASATYLLASEPYTGKYTVLATKGWSNNMIQLQIEDLNGRRSSLSVRRREYVAWKQGAPHTLCVEGRSWILGIIVDAVVDIRRCGRP